MPRTFILKNDSLQGVCIVYTVDWNCFDNADSNVLLDVGLKKET